MNYVLCERDEHGLPAGGAAPALPDRAAELRAVAEARGWPAHRVEAWVREQLGG